MGKTVIENIGTGNSKRNLRPLGSGIQERQVYYGKNRTDSRKSSTFRICTTVCTF